MSVFALLGVAVDGVVVNRFPRKADGWPDGGDGRPPSEALARMVESGADGVAVWKSTSRVRAVPKERSVLGPLERVQVLDAEQLTVHVGEDEFHLDLPLAARGTGRGATVGVQEHRLVVAFDGAMRWLDLPPVLRRCQPVRCRPHRRRTAGALRAGPGHLARAGGGVMSSAGRAPWWYSGDDEQPGRPIPGGARRTEASDGRGVRRT